MKPSRRFTKLLAPISFSETTDAVTNHVRRIAEVNEGEVVLLHVVPTQSYRLHRAIYRPEEAGGADGEHADKGAVAPPGGLRHQPPRRGSVRAEAGPAPHPGAGG